MPSDVGQDRSQREGATVTGARCEAQWRVRSSHNATNKRSLRTCAAERVRVVEEVRGGRKALKQNREGESSTGAQKPTAGAVCEGHSYRRAECSCGDGQSGGGGGGGGVDLRDIRVGGFCEQCLDVAERGVETIR